MSRSEERRRALDVRVHQRPAAVRESKLVSCLKRLGGQKFTSTRKSCSVFAVIILLAHSFVVLARVFRPAPAHSLVGPLSLINMLIFAWPRRPGRAGPFCPFHHWTRFVFAFIPYLYFMRGPDRSAQRIRNVLEMNTGKSIECGISMRHFNFRLATDKCFIKISPLNDMTFVWVGRLICSVGRLKGRVARAAPPSKCPRRIADKEFMQCFGRSQSVLSAPLVRRSLGWLAGRSCERGTPQREDRRGGDHSFDPPPTQATDRALGQPRSASDADSALLGDKKAISG